MTMRSPKRFRDSLLHHYYGPSRPCASRYFAPGGVRRLGSSLSRPGANIAHFD